MELGLNGKILEGIRSLYTDVQCAVKVNDFISPWFPVNSGVKQGCCTLFSVYVNDLAKEINQLGCGVNVDNSIISILLYADDIALIAPDEHSLQQMLNSVNVWCMQWRLVINQGNTKVVHFRGPSVSRSECTFAYGPSDIMFVDFYRYLGLWLNEHLNLKQTVKELTKSASRALSALYTHFITSGGFSFEVFTKLYQSLVEPVLFYGAGVWNVTNFKEVQTVQNKACRLFLGGSKCAANVALRGHGLDILLCDRQSGSI